MEQENREQWLLLVLDAIESVVGDDDCELWDMENASRRFRGRTRLMHEKLNAVYRFAHGANPAHSCHSAHTSWRTEAALAGTALRSLTPPEGETAAGEKGNRA